MELLFKTLETQEYVLPPPKSDPDGGGTPPGINPPPPALNTEKVTESTIPITSMNTNPPAPLQMNGSAPMAIGKRETRKSDSEKVDKEKEKRSRSRWVSFKLYINKMIKCLYSFLKHNLNILEVVEWDHEQDLVHVHGKEIDVDQGAENIFVAIENVIEVDHGEMSRHQIRDGMIEGLYKFYFK